MNQVEVDEQINSGSWLNLPNQYTRELVHKLSKFKIGYQLARYPAIERVLQ